VLHKLIHAFHLKYVFIDFLFSRPTVIAEKNYYIYYLFITIDVHEKFTLCIFYTMHKIIVRLRAFKFKKKTVFYRLLFFINKTQILHET
jgi:hypothetical protein